MTTKASEAFVSSKNKDEETAAKELVNKAFEDLDNADFAFLFTTSKFDTEKLAEELDKNLDGKCENWIGSTTAGELSNNGSSLGGAVLLVVKSEKIDFSIGKSLEAHEDSLESGVKAVKEALPDNYEDIERNKLLYTIMPGLTTEKPGVEFKILKGIVKELGTDVPVIGGSSGDDGVFEENHQIVNGETMNDAVITVSIITDHEVEFGKEHGFNKKVKSGLVNDVEGRTIKEIGGEPAAEWYADSIGEDVETLKETFEAPTGTELSNVMRFALEKGIAEQVRANDLRLITPIQITEGNGLFMTVDVEENNLVHVVEGSGDEIVSAGKKAFEDLNSENTHFGIVSDCTCRNMALDSESLEKEAQLMIDHLNCPVAGFYSYGEIGGNEKGFCTFQNQTVSGFVLHD